MIAVEGDDAALADAVGDLAATVEAAGGYAHSQAAIEASRGALRVCARGPVERDAVLFAVPSVCLPPVNGVNLQVVGDRLGLGRRPDGLETITVTALEKLLAVYEAGGMLAAWRRDFPLTALAADADLIECLLAGVGAPQKLRSHHDLIQAGRGGEAVLRSFIQARIYALPKDAMHRHGFREPAALIPLIECLNHDFFADPISFHVATRDDSRLKARLQRSIPGSSECFVRYQAMDALHSYMEYAFVDARAPVLFSVPVTLSLPGGVQLAVGAGSGYGHRGELPAELAKLSPYVPRITVETPARLGVNRLLLPDLDAPGADTDSFCQILDFILGHAAGGADPATRQGLVLTAEQEILRAIWGFRQRLAASVGTARCRTPQPEPPGRAAALAAVERIVAGMGERIDAYARARGIDPSESSA